VFSHKGHLSAPGGVPAPHRSSAWRGHACGRRVAAALPGTEIYPLWLNTRLGGHQMDYFSILIVDDEVDFLETIVKRLQKRNIDTTGVTSAEKALALMDQRLFDVVVLDIKLPGGMDGIEALREMKRKAPLTEVILLTGHASVETSIEGMKLGAFDYLLKPVKLEDLLVKIGEAFEKKDVHEQKIRKAKIQELMRFPGRVFQQEKDEKKKP
jgi:DNA-binding NtrC family response regulator